jgi:hypothetical protein
MAMAAYERFNGVAMTWTSGAVPSSYRRAANGQLGRSERCRRSGAWASTEAWGQGTREHTGGCAVVGWAQASSMEAELVDAGAMSLWSLSSDCM